MTPPRNTQAAEPNNAAMTSAPWVITVAEPPPTPGPPGATPVDRDHLCVSCGYNLRGLDVTSQCPECAVPVADSLKGDLLAFAGVAYRQRLLRALWLIAFGLVAAVVISLSTTFLGFALARMGTPTSIAGVRTLIGILAFVPYAMMIVGAWMLVLPDPGYNGSKDPATARLWTRIALIAQGVCLIAGVGLTALPFGMPTISTIALVLGVLRVLLWVALFLSTTTYARWIAERIPSAADVATASRLVWLLPLLCAVPFVLSVFSATGLWRAGGMSTIWVVGVLGLLAVACWVVALISFWRLMYVIRAAIARVHAATLKPPA
jgi:hypothetical protein